MKVLVVNAGSSSLKYQLIDMDDKNELAKGLCERIGIDGSNLQHTASLKFVPQLCGSQQLSCIIYLSFQKSGSYPLEYIMQL